jgi:5-methylcytosine-specific restriction endonuclease McrA
MVQDLPQHLPTCEPHQRLFPPEWKESFFRRHFDKARGGYVCPDCDHVFIGTKGLSMLHADHMVPFSKGGLTIWSNLVLRCKPCNFAKSGNLSADH